MMKSKMSKNFWLGFLLAFLTGVAIWYWQKSTSAEDGALDLLDELAKVKVRAQKMSQGVMKETVVTSPRHTNPDDLTAVHGIGPVYARRLQEAGIHTFASLAAQSPERLAQIVQLKEWQAAAPEEWIAQAKTMSNYE